MSEEEQPLLEPSEESKYPRGFVWIQLALMSNVFLHAFDGTITAATYAVISSEFNAANTASWLTTSYLLSSTTVQPLYGRISDIYGRRACFFVSTVTFAAGCLGCGLARSSETLNGMRALTGLGGGGLMTMTTIINSDMIPLRRRGKYQALQNGIWGTGSILGASMGGIIADRIGWRWCFLLQLPLSAMAFIIGYLAVQNQPLVEGGWKKVDFLGSLVLVLAIATQLVGLSLGGNQLPWSSPWVWAALAASVVLFAGFFYVEKTTTTLPILPLRLLKGSLPVTTQLVNLLTGVATFGFIFMLPLYFQVVLLDSPSRAGARLAIPALAIPCGAVATSIVMGRYGKLIWLMRVGSIILALGNVLILLLAFQDDKWKYYVYIFPSNFGTGIVYPSVLFTALATFDHSDHAVASAAIFLVRQLGSVWGVSLTSAILQTTLTVRLPEALKGVPGKNKIIDEIRHSVSFIRQLPPDVQLKAQLVYFDGLWYAFAVTTGAAAMAVVFTFMARGSRLRAMS